MLRLLSLPRDLLLHLLLHHFTVQEVIQFRSLSHDLYDLVHYCLNRRRSLKLFFSFLQVQAYSQLLYEHNLESDPVLRLHPRGPSSDELILNPQQFLNPLVVLLVDTLFPNVTHLIIYFRLDKFKESLQERVRLRDLFIYNVPYMLSRMATRLTGLSLFGVIKGDGIGQRISRLLLHEMNKMNNIRRIDLCVKQLRIVQKDQPFLVLEPKILKKLEQISVLLDVGGNGANFCAHSFCHLGPHLTQLAIHQLNAGAPYHVAEALLCKSLIGATSHLKASSITHLKLTQHLSSLLPKVLPHFTRLKSLDLMNFTFSKTETGMSLLELFRLLAQFCPQLTELKLSKFALGWIRVADDLPQLEHITHLTLKCLNEQLYYDPVIKAEDENIPFRQFLSTFAYIFPNLVRINLKTVPGYFHFIIGKDTVKSLGTVIPRLCMFSLGNYYGEHFTCYQLLSEQYRKRYIRECGQQWEELKKYWQMHYKNAEGIWRTIKF